MNIDRLLELAIQIQQVPAPTFHEQGRAAFVQEAFRREGLLDVTTDELGDVYARLPGNGAAAPLIVSAHLDTVFPADTALTCSRDGDRLYGPGIGDNSLGVAALFGLVWALREQNATLPGDIWLVANVGEEGLGNLRGMLSVVDRFGARVTGYLVIEGTALAHIYHRAIAVQRYRITVRTAGGHSWSDYGQPSAIHELARIVTQMTSVPLPASPRSSLNVGLISGGTGVNVLAPEARLELDIRSESPEALDGLFRRVKDIVEAADREGVSSTLELIGKRPAGHEIRSVAGWQVHVSKGLLQQERAATARALELLKIQLEEVVRVLPKPVATRLQQVPLWFSPEYPGVRPTAEYHPNRQWLCDHGRDPALAKAVEFTNVRLFEQETRRMPFFAFHELAHAYHDQVLGFDNAEIQAVYEAAKKSGRYDKVKRWTGEKITEERAYAMTNAKEYFA